MNLVRTAMLIAVMTALFMGVGYMIGGSGGMMTAFFIAAATNLFSYWNADKMVLRMNRAVEVDARNAPEFHAIVERLAANAGLPMPKVYLIDQPQPNAFATGRNPQNAAVAATTGLLQRLNADEVGAVMAHELAHIQHRDTLTMTITATLAGAISMLGNFALFFGGNRNNNNSFGALGTIIAVVVAPFAAMIVQMAVSRTREYSADQRGAEICGNPLALASALAKIANAAKRIENPAAERNPAMAHLFIYNPLHGERMDNLFSTHPNVENRIAALEEMARSSHFGQSARPQANAAPSEPAAGYPGPWDGARGNARADDDDDDDEPTGPWGRNPGQPNDRWS